MFAYLLLVAGVIGVWFAYRAVKRRVERAVRNNEFEGGG